MGRIPRGANARSSSPRVQEWPRPEWPLESFKPGTRAPLRHGRGRPNLREQSKKWAPASGGKRRAGVVHSPAVIDIRLIREKPDEVRAGFARLGAVVDFDGVLALDARVRDLKNDSQNLQAEQNRMSKE